MRKLTLVVAGGIGVSLFTAVASSRAHLGHHLASAGLSERQIMTLSPERVRTAHAVVQHALDFDVPVEFALRVAWQESRFNPRAVGPQTPWGRAYGPMQVLPSTARTVEPGVTARALLHPETGTRVGMAYLSRALREQGHDHCRAAMRYHGGPNQRLWGPRTRAYCAAITRNTPPGRAPRGAERSFEANIFGLTGAN